jgi:hypothetical protein
MLKRIALLAVGVFIGIVVGVACTYALMRRDSYKWIELQIDLFGVSYANEVFAESDIPLPDLKTPHGQAKFVDRGIGKGKELGFVVRASMDKLDKSKLPRKIQKVEAMGESHHRSNRKRCVQRALGIYSKGCRWVRVDDDQKRTFVCAVG